MSKHSSSESRRRFIKITAICVTAAPFAKALSSSAGAAPEMVPESDPTATALSYKMDATKALKRQDKNATCANCNLYTSKPGAANGACSIFGGRLVSAKGWCTAWVKKA